LYRRVDWEQKFTDVSEVLTVSIVMASDDRGRGTSETSVSIYQLTRRIILDASHMNVCRQWRAFSRVISDTPLKRLLFSYSGIFIWPPLQVKLESGQAAISLE
jgi:hypothetical protein